MRSKTPRRLSVRTFLVALGLSAGCLSDSFADNFTWTGAAGNGLWTDPANWMNTTSGGTATVPDGDDDVTFNIDATTTNGAARNVTNSATLTATAGRIAFGSGTITNSGTLSFEGSGSSSDEVYLIDDAVTLSGNGEIVMVESFDSLIASRDTEISDNGTPDVLTNAAGHTIRGAGTISVDLINQGTLKADVSGQLLQARATMIGGTVNATNNGFLGFFGISSVNTTNITADSGSTIRSSVVDFDNAGGSITLADGATLDPETNVIRGGNISGGSGSGSFLDGRAPNFTSLGSLRDVNISGRFRKTAGTRVGLQGTITNSGTLSFEGSGSSSDEVYLIDDAVTLSGNGEIVMVESFDSLIASRDTEISDNGTPDVLTNAAGHTIRGAGTISVDLINQGTLKAENSKLTAFRTVTGDGNLEVDANAEFEINGPQASAATITVDPTGTLDFNGDRISFNTFNGSFLHDTGTLAPNLGVGTATISGDYTMSGSTGLEIDLAGTGAGEFDQLNVGGDASLTGDLDIAIGDQVAAVGSNFSLDVLTANEVTGGFTTTPASGEHLGYGVFFDSVVVNTSTDVVSINASQDLFPADFDQDGRVDSSDLDDWQAGYGSTGTAATLANGDADASGAVEGFDFLIWQRNFGAGIAPNTQGVPEPTSASLLLLICTSAILSRQPRSL